MPADLHIHTNLSDGMDSPEEIVKIAQAAGLTAIAITDHDTVAGSARAWAAGGKSGIEVVPGIEFTTELLGAEIHVLGYFIDAADAKLNAILRKIQKGRRDRIYKIVEKLKGLGVQIEADDVFEIAKNDSPGRPHVAKALIKAGIVSSFKEAFNRYIDFKGPAYVSHYKLSPYEAVKIIKEAGGVPVYAHPAVSARDNIIPDLMKEGLRGIEVLYPGYGPEQIKHYKKLALKYGLIVTGGTDFHGVNSGREVKLGDILVPDEAVAELKAEKDKT